MIKRSTLPRSRGMALRAICREVCGLVIWIGNALVLIEMATRAIRRNRTNFAFVTLRAFESTMSQGQREGRRMIKRRARPRNRAVALRAFGRELGLDVVRIVRTLVIVHVARGAICGKSRRDSLRVALGAVDALVSAAQREGRRMLERNSVPRCRCVALGAVGAEIILLVVWIVRAHKILEVTRRTLV